MFSRSERRDNREFDPSFSAVAKAWSTVPKAQRDQHFFGVVDFDDAPAIFTKVRLRVTVQ